MFSKACEYGIRATLYIALKSKQNSKVGLTEIAEKIESPEAFTSKILQQLVREKIIKSLKGPGGGFYMSEIMACELSIISIVECFEGDVLSRCSLGLENCSDDRPCPFHFRYKPIKEKLIKVFTNTTVNDLIKGLDLKETHLKL